MRPSENLNRTNLRLSAEALAAIDCARALRPGSVSRNTWIVEAIYEKLSREAGNREGENSRSANG